MRAINKEHFTPPNCNLSNAFIILIGKDDESINTIATNIYKCLLNVSYCCP